MKKLGILGGLAWPSTADYYRLICEMSNAHFKSAGGDAPYPTPPMTIESLNIHEMRRLRGSPGDEDTWAPYEAVLLAALGRLAAAGADLAIMASNTPHNRLHAIEDRLPLPLVSILSSTATAISEHGARRALILGTPVTMRSPAYADALRAAGVEPVHGVAEETIDQLQRLIDVDLFDDVRGARRELLAICRQHLSDPATEVVCLACTELPIAFPELRDLPVFETDGMTFVNATVVHARAAFTAALG